MEPQITLDKPTFKALASETRVAVLKLLQQRRHMQSEIAAELEMAVPTVKEHLDALEKAGLVIRYEEGRKWKYYGLTAKGKAILDPEQKRIWIVLVALVFAAIGSVVTFFQGQVGKFAAAAPAMEMKAAAPSLEMMAAPLSSPQPAPIPMFIWFVIATLVFTAVLIYLFVRRARWQKHLGKPRR